MKEQKRPEEIYAISGYVTTDNSDKALYRFIKLKPDKFGSYKEIDSVYIPTSGVDEFLSDGKEFAYRRCRVSSLSVAFLGLAWLVGS